MGIGIQVQKIECSSTVIYRWVEMGKVTPVTVCGLDLYHDWLSKNEIVNSLQLNQIFYFDVIYIYTYIIDPHFCWIPKPSYSIMTSHDISIFWLDSHRSQFFGELFIFRTIPGLCSVNNPRFIKSIEIIFFFGKSPFCFLIFRFSAFFPIKNYFLRRHAAVRLRGQCRPWRSQPWVFPCARWNPRRSSPGDHRLRWRLDGAPGSFAKLVEINVLEQ